MNRDRAAKEFVMKYNDALHFLTYEDGSVFARRSFIRPPRCLYRTMKRAAAHVHKLHTEYIAENGTFDDLSEPVEINMDFDGIEI